MFGPTIEETPREYLFYSGGGSSVRGQPYQSLGAEAIVGSDGTTIETGGMSVANATAEIRYQLRERIGLVGFADAGKVWTDGSFGGDSDWHAGAGVGVRYNTPIGPLRFDVAGPVGGDTGEPIVSSDALTRWSRRAARIAGSRSPAKTARMMRMPVAPVMSDTTWCNCRFICISAFCMCWMCDAA